MSRPKIMPAGPAMNLPDNWEEADRILTDYRYTGSATAGTGYRADIWRYDGKNADRAPYLVMCQYSEEQSFRACLTMTQAHEERERFAAAAS